MQPVSFNGSEEAMFEERRPRSHGADLNLKPYFMTPDSRLSCFIKKVAKPSNVVDFFNESLFPNLITEHWKKPIFFTCLIPSCLWICQSFTKYVITCGALIRSLRKAWPPRTIAAETYDWVQAKHEVDRKATASSQNNCDCCKSVHFFAVRLDRKTPNSKTSTDLIG